MSGEIVVSETPNWLNDLEAKRERRLKARLGHEAGAGAPCLKCGDKCPGLDLHFWRKACKICRCPKEEHDVPDDDIYGWAQFQLLGSKPNKIKTKIVLPGKNDEVELEWAPKGQKDTIDKYLKTLPPEALPVKGSQAAQERKQLLQKQIPVHDIDPTLCHELNEEEVKKMEEYIAHIKKSSVGVGQIVNLSSVIKANLHNISPQEAHIIASRYSKGVPFSEILKLQASLAQNLENLTLNNSKNTKNHPTLPAMQPNKLHGNIQEESIQNALPAAKFKDITHPWYTQTSPGKGGLNPQYAENFKVRPGGRLPQRLAHDSEIAIDEKLIQGTNFDPSKTPSQFLGYHTPGYKGKPHDPSNAAKEDFSSASMPYGKVAFETASGVKPSFSQNLQGPRNDKQSADQYGFENPYFNQNRQDSTYSAEQRSMPFSETQEPKPPRSVKDLIYSTYDPSKGPIPQNQDENITGNRDVDSKMQGYDPNTVFNTYKHDPSIVRHENLPEAGKYNPALPLGKQYSADKLNPKHHGLCKYDPVTGKYVIEDHQYPDLERGGVLNYYPDLQHGRGKYDPVTGKYVMEDHKYPDPEPGVSKFNPDNSDLKHDLRKYDPVSGMYITEDSKYPGHEHGGLTYNPENPNQKLGLRKFDPLTGKYTVEDHRYPEPGYDISKSKFDPITGKYVSNVARDKKYPHDYGSATYPNRSGLPRFDPITGKYILEDHLFPESGEAQHPSDIENENNFESNRLQGPNKSRNPLTALQPGHINVSEDYLEPHLVNVGAIQDINPEIRAATTELNPGYDKESLYGDTAAEYSPESIREILNNIKLPDCHYCKKPFDENEFAVTIDRANVLFHAQCFKCAGCNQSLADNIYFYHKETNNVYCGRDYAKIKGYPRCSACDELIFTKEYCLAENSTFHLKHFCCFQCDTPLAGQDYTLEDEKPYCLPCYESSKAAICSTCEKVIKPDEIGCQLNGVHFHAEDRCFRCIVCSMPLMGKKLLLRNEKLYCSHECFNTGKK